MKKILLAVFAALTFASVSQAFDWSYESTTTWVSNSYESTSSTFGYYYLYYADGQTSEFNNDDIANGVVATNGGIGQIFDVTNTFTVRKIRMLSQRYYNTNDMYVTIYKDIDSAGGPPENYMLPENIVAQFTLDPSNSPPRSSSGSGNGDVLTFNLATNEYFDLSPLGDNTDTITYYFHVDFENVDYGTNTPWRLFLWNAAVDYDPNGYFITPDGSWTSADSRDLGIAFESTAPPVVILPEIPTNWILPVADTGVRRYESGKTTVNYGGSTELATRHYFNSGGVLSEPGTYRDYNTYVRFDLTDLAGATITNATFEITRQAGGTLVNGRVRFLGLDNVVSNTPQDWGEFSLTGDSVGAEAVDYTTNSVAPTDGFYTNRVADFEEGTLDIVETVSGDVASVSGAALADWLNTRLADADTNGNIYATFIVDFPVVGGNQSIYYYSRENLGTLDQDKVPHLILEWTGGGPIGPQFDPTINSISVVGGTATIVWESDVNGTYRIENKAALDDPSWNPVPGATNLPAAGAGGVSTPVPVSGDAEFFRVYGE